MYPSDQDKQAPSCLCRSAGCDSQVEPWNKLLAQCGANQLGASAPNWLTARDEIVRHLSRNQSVNLVVHGNGNWRALLNHIQKMHLPDLAIVDLEDPDTASRHGLLTTINWALGARTSLLPKPDDLSCFKKFLMSGTTAKVALTHFDYAPYRQDYDIDLFATLRFLIMTERKLVLLVQSRIAFNSLLPREHPLSDIDIQTVTLEALA